MDTIYMPGSEIGLMTVMLNAVAMICNSATLIWSVALVASVWLTLKGVASAPVMRWQSLQTGLMGGLIAMLMASFLTNPAMKRSVNVQSSTSGVVARVDNIPAILSLPYTLPSAIVYDAQGLITTAISNVNPPYDQLSVDSNGLVNPLKSLLNLRSVAVKTGALESEISEVVSACLSSDSGLQATDFATIGRLVMNSGNTGASSTQTVEIPSITKLPTNIGALLYQAAQNTTDKVPGYVLASDPSMVLSCPDAVNAVKSDIANTLSSADFQKWITGSVNASDTLNPNGSPTFTELVAKYGASRQMTVANYVTNAAANANADVINMAFYELVDSQLNCLRASGETKSACLATASQTIEMERKNLNDAANMSASQAYMSQFGPQILSLLMVLSPFLFMFAMFSGVTAGAKLGRVIGYVVVPLVMPALVAEAVNAMVLYKFASFLNQLTGGAFLSHSLVNEAYKELSINIGIASSVMSSMPVVILGLIGLSEAASKSYDKSVAAASSSTNSTTPQLTETGPVLATRAAGNIHPNLQGGAVLHGSGASDPAAAGTLMSLARSVTQSTNDARLREVSVSTASNWAQDISRSFHSGTSKQTGVGTDLHSAVRKSLESTQGALTSIGQDSRYSTDKVNNRNSAVSVGADLKGGVPLLGGGGGGVKLGVSVGGTTSAGATDIASVGQTTTSHSSADQANRLTKAMSSDFVKKAYQNASKEEREAFDKIFRQTRTAAQTLSNRDSTSESAGTSSELRKQVAVESAKADADTVATAVKTNSDFRFAALEAEMAANQNPVLSKAFQRELQAMQTGGRPGASISDSASRNAIATMRALGQVASDEKPSAERDIAQQHLLNMFAGLNHQRLDAFKAPQGSLGISVASAQTSSEQTRSQVEGKVLPHKSVGKTGGRASSTGHSPASAPSSGSAPAGRNLPPPRGKNTTPTLPVLDNLPSEFQNVVNTVKQGSVQRITSRATSQDALDSARRNAGEVGLVSTDTSPAKGTVRRAAGNASNAALDDQTPVELHRRKPTGK